MNKAGQEFVDRAINGEIPRYEIEEVMRGCFERPGEFHPQEGGVTFFPPEDGFFEPSEHDFEQLSEGNFGEVPDFNNLPLGVLECVKSTFGSDFLERVGSGEVGNLQEQIRVCFGKINSGDGFLSEPAPVPFPNPISPEPVLCIQVITPAHNPETKECRKFSTPCDVPPGWVQGCPNLISPETVTEPIEGGNLLDAIKSFLGI